LSIGNRQTLRKPGWLVIGMLAAGFPLLVAEPATRSVPSGAFRLPPGFVLEQYADEKLANDIYAMTLDEQGRVVVTSAGYIKRLEDSDGDGRADRAVLLATPRSGGMGLFCDGEYLYYCGDGWLSRYRRIGPNGELASEPEKILPLAFNEHGGHAMRKGPDGWWYVMAGNDARVTAELVNDPASPIRRPEAGCILRLHPPKPNNNRWQVQVIAHGFRNPYDFDFGPGGEIFTYDSDVERTFLLPWYVPTRIYHVAWGGHHGWRLPGYLRSWARCDDYLDTVDMLWPIGRGSPTGVVCYRHWQFPERYRGGLFVADWTFGRIYFVPLAPHGCSYGGRPEVFLEPTGQEGFAPTDLAVGRDGELFVCIGGRRTRGSVYRIRYVGQGAGRIENLFPPGQPPVKHGGLTSPAVGAASELDQVLRAPQPLDAWSRAVWEPRARKLGQAAFLQAARDATRPAPERVRAIEIVTELFGGLDLATARVLVSDAAYEVRAATAWSLGCLPLDDTIRDGEAAKLPASKGNSPAALLLPLATDAHPLVRRRALEALARQRAIFPDEALTDAICRNLDSPEKRVRQAAASLARLLAPNAWQSLWQRRHTFSQRAQLTLGLAYCWRQDQGQWLPEVAELASHVLASETATSQDRWDALRLVMLACGDWELDKPPVEILSGYTLRHQLPGELRKRLLAALHRHWPTHDARWNQEAARLLAMLRDDTPQLPDKLATFWSPQSDPTWDLHYLIVLACAGAAWPEKLVPQVADVLVGLQQRLEGKQLRVKLTWGERLAELVQLLTQRQPLLARHLAQHPQLVQPSQVFIALALPLPERTQAAERFLQTAGRDPDFVWTPALVQLLAELPPEKSRPVLRSRLQDPALRPVVLKYLARHPDETDRQAYLEGLDSAQPDVVQACLEALERLPVSRQPPHQAWLLRALRSQLSEPRAEHLRQRLVRLYCQSADIASPPRETQKDSKSLRETYRPLWEAFLKQHPELATIVLGDTEADDRSWRERLARVNWAQGQAARGEVLFRQRGCLACHTGTSRIGPDLSGVTSRFSREDLFEAIFFPSREVAPAYRTELVETHQGQVYTGIVIFESADGIILQTDATTTIRLATEDIRHRSVGRRSLMPDGLLKDLTDSDLADLYAFLQTLTPTTILPR
jgi:putative heme-binding domain-containing protein